MAANARQFLAMLRSHIAGDNAHFLSVAMQVAAQQAKSGHGNVAKEIREVIDEAKINRNPHHPYPKVLPIVQPQGELADLLTVSYPKLHLSDMVVDITVSEQLMRLMKEQRQVVKLRAHGLEPRRKLLLVGPPGTGKTMSANMLAGELGLPLFVVRLDSLLTKYMGETSVKLRFIFDAISRVRGVYLFDEFDSIGSQRGIANDVGEIRRVLNSFLQLIDQDKTDSIVLAATNHPEILDYALFRRFDDIVKYQLPQRSLMVRAFEMNLASVKKGKWNWEKLGELSTGLSYADITRICQDAIKNMIIYNESSLIFQVLIKFIEERKSLRN
jgi:SpoVK/Ycf46/Vps4 family AAA+-type ATPase